MSPTNGRDPELERAAPLPRYQAAVDADESRIARDTGHPGAPRLARHVIRLDDGHQVTVAIAGHGVPFVVVHGFMAEGFMYAQTLNRLVALGYKVVAIDTAGHGGTEVLSDAELDFDAYVTLFSRALAHLGIREAVFTGHSMGGRVVAELAAEHPDRVVALVLLDPILGAPWDRIVARARMLPPLLAWRGFLIAADTASTFPFVRDRGQARKLGRLLAPTILRHIRRPWQLLAPAVAILRSAPSRQLLERIRAHATPTIVVHGARDYVVPLATARDAAERAGAHLVIVHGATHSWCLKDPETLPAVVQSLAEGPLGDAYAAALERHGLDADASIEEIEAAFYEPGARARSLTPELRFVKSDEESHAARYRFTLVDSADRSDESDGPRDANAGSTDANAGSGVA